MLALLLLALALASDAFAVALVRGAAGPHRFVRALETGAAFALAQGLMALAGWALGRLFFEVIAAIDHWVAFVLLAVLGVRMVRAGLADDDAGLPPPARNAPRIALLAAAVATSIDAAAAGLALDLFAVPVLIACGIIAAVTLVLCVPAYWFGAQAGSRLGRGAEIGGGMVLIVLGCQILLSHEGWI